jgi:hypothetical protein
LRFEIHMYGFLPHYFILFMLLLYCIFTKSLFVSMQGQIQIWMEHSTLNFENLKPVEKSFQHHLNIIKNIDFQN